MFDSHPNFRRALLEKDSKTVLNILQRYKDNAEFMRGIPPTTFTEILRLLYPSTRLSRTLAEYTMVSPSKHRWSGGSRLEKVVGERITTMYDVAKARRNHGMKLGLTDYKLLMKAAAWCGDKRVAELVWEDMAADDIIPDIDCWNALFSASLWNNHYSGRSRYLLRATSYHLGRRRSEDQRDHPEYKNFGVGPGGIKEGAMSFFKRLLQSGAVPTEESMVLLMLAHAREGDSTAADTILKRVWNVDVGTIVNGRFDPDAVKPLPRSSPVHPTERLLLAIADVYGSNSDSATAVGVVSAVSTAYDIPITRPVWELLFEWAFVLSRPRSGRWHLQHQPDAGQGKVHLEALARLWQTMTSPPYSIRPSIAAYNDFIRAHASAPFRIDELLHLMREGLALYRQSATAATAASARLADAEAAAASARHPPAPPTWQPHPSAPSLTALRAEARLARYVRDRDALLVRRWVRLLLPARLARKRALLGVVPDALAEFAEFAPRLVRYRVESGWVELELRGKEEEREGEEVGEREGEGERVERFAKWEWEREREWALELWRRRKEERRREEREEREKEEGWSWEPDEGRAWKPEKWRADVWRSKRNPSEGGPSASRRTWHIGTGRT